MDYRCQLCWDRPNITGSYTANYLTARNDQAEATGSLIDGGKQSGKLGTSGADGQPNIIIFDASQGNAIYGTTSSVQPPALTFLACIKI